MIGRQNLRLAISGCALAITFLVLPDKLAAQTASSEVGVVLRKDGEIVATRQSRETPVEEYSVLVEGMTLRLAAKAQMRFVHNKEGVTYVIAGPAVVTISQKSVAAEPVTAILSKTSSRLAVEMAAPGAAPVSKAPPKYRVGGESLDNTRAGLVGSPKSAKAAPAKAIEAPKAVEASKAAPKAMSRSEREAQRDAEVPAKAIGKPAEQIAAAAPTVAAAPAAKGGSDNEAMYQQALEMERGGKAADAVRIYRRAARAGHGKSAKRLGDIFDRGVPGVSRDYAESMQWYQTARDLGEDVPAAAAR